MRRRLRPVWGPAWGPVWGPVLAAGAAVLALSGCARQPGVVVRQATPTPSAASPSPAEPSPSPAEAPPAPSPPASPTAPLDTSAYTVCSASVTRLSPPAGGRQTIEVRSTVPGSAVSAVLHYGERTTQSVSGTTDERGRAALGFRTLARVRAGTSVRVDVSVGPARCSTTFTVG